MLSAQVMVRPRLLAAGAGAVVLAVGALVASPMVMTSGPVVAVILVGEWHRWAVGVQRRARNDLMPAVVDHVIQQLRSGASLRQSCESLARRPVLVDVPAVASLSVRLRSGATLGEAARALTHHGERSDKLLAVTLQVLAANGGPAVPALQRLRYTVVGTLQADGQARAEAAQSMASARLMVLAPAVFAVAVAALDRNAARLYAFEPVGAACVLAAAVLSYLGWRWLQHLLTTAIEGAR